jgi:ribosomal protein S18 acetylase RimI-like enzyme
LAALPIVTEELARRLEAVGVEFIAGWLRGIPGVRVERFGAAEASLNPSLADVDFMNTVMGLYPEDAEVLGAILAFYAEAGVRPWLELPPAPGFDALSEPLADAGAVPVGFHTMLYGAARRAERDPRVREARPDEAAEFGDVLLRGHGAPDDAPRTHIVAWAERSDSRMYVAEVDGRIGAAGALVLHDDLAYLANASTLPEARGRGLQSALIAARVDAAARAGIALVSAQAAWSSPSQRNLERAGLRVAYTKTVWRVR